MEYKIYRWKILYFNLSDIMDPASGILVLTFIPSGNIFRAGWTWKYFHLMGYNVSWKAFYIFRRFTCMEAYSKQYN